ncbi:DUF6318 family protein [Arthrobacter monumenti]
MPEAATKETKAGLEAFVRHWFDLVSHSYATGDLDPAKSHSGSSCETCAFVYDSVASAYKDGGWSAGGQMTIKKIGTEFTKENIAGVGPSYTVAAVVGQGKITFYNSKGEVSLKEEPDAPVGFTLVLTYGANGWTMENANIVGSSN